MTDISSELLNEAIALRDREKERAERKQKELEDVKSHDVHVSLSFPLVEDALMEMQTNLNHVSNRLWQISKLDDELDAIKNTAAWVEKYGEFLSNIIRHVGHLKNKKQFDKAISELKNVKIPAELGSFKFVKLFLEMRHCLLTSIYFEKAEMLNESSQLPLSDDEYQELVALVNTFPIGIHDDRYKNTLLDQLLGISFLRSTYKLDNERLTPTLLEGYLDDLQKFQYRERRHTLKTQWRCSAFRYRLVNSYNDSCAYYFDSHPEYKDALALFHVKTMFRLEEIKHPAYRDSQNDNDFKVAFLSSDMMRKDGGDFYEEVASVIVTATTELDDSTKSLAAVLCNPDLDSTRKEILFDEILKRSFEQRIFIFDAALSMNVSKKDEIRLLQCLEANGRARKADLEKVASALFRIRKSISPYLLERFETVVKSLFRSSKSIKIAVKSPFNEVRQLSNFGFKDPPKGAKFPSRVIKARPLTLYVILWIFAVLIPLAIAGAGSYCIYRFCPEAYQPYAYLAPVLFLFIYLIVTISRHCGTDERGSAYARRILGVLYLLSSIFTLVYFIIPGQMTFMQGFGYTFIIGTSMLTLLTMMLLKDFRRKLGFWSYWPTMFLLFAALIFLIVDMMNGVI